MANNGLFCGPIDSTMQQQYKNIIFDLGGVLFDIDYQRPVQAFAALGYTGFDAMYSQAAANPLFEQLETGHISNLGFLQAMATLAPVPVSGQQIEQAWNSILLGFRLPSMQCLQQLRQYYQLYLLSNTNAIHLVQIQALCQKQTGQSSLDDFFTKAWYSNRVGLRKPNANIYQFVLQDGSLRAEETLFIDDSVQNITAAENLGIQGHLLLPGQTIESLGLI
jgi:glucose-1-phosphatase